MVFFLTDFVLERVLVLRIFLALSALSLVNSVLAANLVSGPMPGYPAQRQAMIWLQVDRPATVQITYWPADKSTKRMASVAQRVGADDGFVAKIPLLNLEAGQSYHYEVNLDGSSVTSGQKLSFHTQELWQWRKDPPAFEIALGSCAYINETAWDRPGKPYGSDFEIFDQIASEKPAMMLWLGDNLYLREGDFDSPGGMAHRYSHARAFGPLQNLLRSTHHVAIWDDHDFGPNNSNSSFIFADEALKLFRRYWPNPSSGSRALAGTQTMVGYGDAEFFLLDGRYYRDDDHAPAGKDKQLYGPGQMRWLRNALSASTATFKFIAGGSQFLNTTGRQEGWHHFSRERDEFLSWLERSKISGVIFLSGDRHASEWMRFERKGSYPLHELTCSPLTSGVRLKKYAEDNANRVADSFVDTHNYCLLRFSGSKKERQLQIQVKDIDGETRWEHSLSAASLRAEAK